MAVTNKKRPTISKKRSTASHKRKPFQIKNKKRVLIIGIAVLIVIIGVIAGILTFMISTSAKLSISDEAKKSLTSIQENQARYTLMSLDLDDDPENKTDYLALIRSDPKDKQFIVVIIPVDTYVPISGGGGTTLKKISANNNDAELISSVATFAEAGINHFIKLNKEGFESLVDALGGIEIDLKEQIDDPAIGSTYIPAGKSKLNGTQCSTVLISKNYKGKEDTIAQNQREIARGLIKAISNSDNNSVFTLDKIAGDVKSDMSAGEILDINKKYKDITDDDILDTSVPGYRTTRSNELVFIIDATQWKIIKTQMSYGTLPNSETTKTLEDVDTKSFTIQICNGTNIDGFASTLAEKLKSYGCNIAETGNADNQAYNQTLIIYKDKKNKDNAMAIKGTLENGRVIDGTDAYSNIKYDIMIIIGNDFKI